MQADEKRNADRSEPQKKDEPAPRGSSFNEEHRDIKQSEFLRSIAGTDPTRKEEDDASKRDKNIQ